MNFFLYINRNLIFFIGFCIIFAFVALLFSKQINLNNIQIEISTETLSDADIEEPKFAISNDSKKIYITAKMGNFLNDDEILLENNVRFKSNNFSIETDKVVFNRNEQTAQSKTKSLFKSESTTILSDGFDIYEKGNKITFYGNSHILLK